MTRKQALSLAIQALSDIGQKEAAETLHTLSEELPMNRWSDAAILDSIDQFILDNGRVPTSVDFKKRGLPPHTVIKQRYGITLREWLNEHYPVTKPSDEAICAEITKSFIEDYRRIRPKSAEEFNEKRSSGTRCWYSVAIRNHTKCWRNLLAKLELPIYNNVNVPREKPEFTVTIYTHYDFRD